jgi:cyanophycinase-like exopeptidase
MKSIYIIAIILLSLSLPFAYQSEITGDPADVETQTTQGSVLMGGGSDVEEAFQWMIEKSGGGDFVVIRYNSLGSYNNFIYGLGEVNSVETIAFESSADAQDQTIIDKIRNAEALWMAGGDQSNYVDGWKDTPIEDAINYLIHEKQCPVGGTSAGCAVMTPIYWGATSGSWSQYETAADVFQDPYQSGRNGMGFNDFIDPPFLQNTISDQHYIQRSRQYRHIAMMAYTHSLDYTPIRGIACNEATAVCIEPDGKAIVFGKYSDSHAFFLSQYCNGPEVYEDSQPLDWKGGFKVYKVLGNDQGDQFLDLTDWQTVDGNGTWEYWYADNGSLVMADAPYEECTDTIPTRTVQKMADVQTIIFNGITYRFAQPLKTVRILSAAGSFIRELPVNNNTAVWDGRNQKGIPVSAGLYVFQVTTQKKQTIYRLAIATSRQ